MFEVKENSEIVLETRDFYGVLTSILVNRNKDLKMLFSIVISTYFHTAVLIGLATSVLVLRLVVTIYNK